MKILPFIFCLFLVLGSLAYVRFEQVFSEAFFHKEYEKTALPKMFARFSLLQQNLYDDHHASFEKEHEIEEPKTLPFDPKREELLENKEEKAGHLSSYFNLRSLFEKEKSDDFLKGTLFFKKMLTILYGEQLFFQEGKKHFPDLEDRILSAMVTFTQEDKNAKNTTLIQIPFEEEEIRIIFCKILQGTRSKKDWKEGGYAPLTDFFTISNTSKAKPISLYLAPPETLLALFERKEIVEDLLVKRKNLYKQVIKDFLGLEEAKKELEQAFSSYLSVDIDPKMVSFQVSKTNPNRS